MVEQEEFGNASQTPAGENNYIQLSKDKVNKGIITNSIFFFDR